MNEFDWERWRRNGTARNRVVQRQRQQSEEEFLAASDVVRANLRGLCGLMPELSEQHLQNPALVQKLFQVLNAAAAARKDILRIERERRKKQLSETV